LIIFFEQVDEYSYKYCEYHRIALSYYNSAAQFNATALVAVVFGQFTILTLLEGMGRLLRIGFWPNIPIEFLIVVYVLILCLGCYFIVNYFMFARFIEKLRECSGTTSLTTLENRMINDIRAQLPLVAWLRDRRKSAFGWQYLDVGACAVYVVVSCWILKAALWLPMLRH